jgi:hypothetical protein
MLTRRPGEEKQAYPATPAGHAQAQAQKADRRSMSARPYLKVVEKPPSAPPWPRIEVRISTTMARRPYGRSRSFLLLGHRELAQLLVCAERLEELA